MSNLHHVLDFRWILVTLSGSLHLNKLWNNKIRKPQKSSNFFTELLNIYFFIYFLFLHLIFVYVLLSSLKNKSFLLLEIPFFFRYKDFINLICFVNISYLLFHIKFIEKFISSFFPFYKINLNRFLSSYYFYFICLFSFHYFHLILFAL